MINCRACYQHCMPQKACLLLLTRCALMRRRGESLTKERWSMRGSATRVILIAASILALILMIAATHHPRTQVCPFNVPQEFALHMHLQSLTCLVFPCCMALLFSCSMPCFVRDAQIHCAITSYAFTCSALLHHILHTLLSLQYPAQKHGTDLTFTQSMVLLAGSDAARC